MTEDSHSKAQPIDYGKVTWIERLLNTGSHALARPLIRALERHCRGAAADVGGDDFYALMKNSNVEFSSWTTIDLSTRALQLKDRFPEDEFRVVIGDGCDLKGVVADDAFETVVTSQTLEHVREPQLMVNECARIMKPGGTGIFYLPQTSVLHMAPRHYYNFTRYWIEEAVREAGLEIVEYVPVGGTWASHASHLVFLVVQIMRNPHFVPEDVRRNLAFYLLLPLMIAYAIAAFPLMMLFSIGDLKEGANNHLVVARKPPSSAG